MEKIIIDLEAKTDKALKGIDGVAKSVEELSKEVVESNKNTTRSFKGVEIASKGVAKGVRAVGTGLKAIGLGLIISALGTLKELFSQNQKAVDTFNVIFETAAQVVGQVSTAFKDVYNSLTQSTDQLDALGKVASGLVTLALTPLKLSFYAIKLGIDQAMLAWENSFLGDKNPETIKALNESIIETKTNILEVGQAAVDAGKDVVTNFGEAVSEVSEISKTVVKEFSEISISAATKAAEANVKLQNSAEIAAARQGLLFEKFDRQAEKLRQIRDDETKSITERKAKNDELLVAINEAEVSMLSQAETQLAIANENLKKDKDNVEFKVAQIEAEKELAGVRAQIEGIRSEQISNALALDKESLEITNTKLESESNLSIERKRFNAELIEDELLKLEKLKEVESLFQEQETLRLEAIVLNANAGTQAKIDAQTALDEFTETSRQTNATKDKEISKAKIKIAETEAAAKSKTLGDTENALNSLGALAGEQTAAGKAMGIASATINTYRGVSDALAATTVTPFETALKFVNAGAILASGLKNVKKIVSVKVPSGGRGVSGGGSSPSGGSVGNAPSIPPAFNVVGQSDTNQLASAIGGQSQQPIQAFVVSNDVTTAQSMDRNIVDGASI